VLARTDRDASPHKGISYLIVDLRSPGVTVSPLALSTGDAEFGEVFFEDVKVPRDNLLGALNSGWGIAMHTLSHERGPYAMARQTILSVLLDRLLREAERIPRDGVMAIDVSEIRHGLAQVKISLEVLKHQCYRSIGTALANGSPGFESSVDKVLLGRAEQQLAQIALDVLGPYATLADETWSELFGVNPGEWHHTYLYGRAGSVYGGSAQIQKNIIAERILGLPRSS
jgi:alkylation response protein AidB-like acyl-CoA dehydrogenase